MHALDPIRNGSLGIELGSTRIKAVLIGPDRRPLASGEHGWRSALRDGVWTYSLDEVWVGVQACFEALREDVEARHGVSLTRVAAIGISAMMHGYLVFDGQGRLLVPFRTWRNNTTGPASEELSKLFDYPIPQRWSIAHLYQAILNGEPHVRHIAHMMTLAGYVHWKLTGQKVLGVGDASGMFPIDIGTCDFDPALIDRFDARIQGEGFEWKLQDILPRVLGAGTQAGMLTEEGARLLDPSGLLEAWTPLCPPEGDAGTGMVATHSVAPRTGNVSAGTSVFAMVVLEKPFAQTHREIDLVATPDGKPVGMVHANNGMADTDAWLALFAEAASAVGSETSLTALYDALIGLSLKGDPDCGGLLSYGYIAGEHITGFGEGRPLFIRSPDSNFTLSNFMRSHLYSTLCALRIGLDVLIGEEGVRVDVIRGHGGFFKSGEVGKRMMAAATEVPVSTLDTAGEGGAWGIALLAAFMAENSKEKSLSDFLEPVFVDCLGPSTSPDPSDVAGFQRYFDRYRQGLAIEGAAVKALSEENPECHIVPGPGHGRQDNERLSKH